MLAQRYSQLNRLEQELMFPVLDFDVRSKTLRSQLSNIKRRTQFLTISNVVIEE